MHIPPPYRVLRLDTAKSLDTAFFVRWRQFLGGCVRSYLSASAFCVSFFFSQMGRGVSWSSEDVAILAAFLEKGVKPAQVAREWPPQSPDLNPLDFSIWNEIARKLPLCRNSMEGKAILKAAVIAETSKLSIEYVQKTCTEGFEARLWACLRAKGGHFEHLL